MTTNQKRTRSGSRPTMVRVAELAGVSIFTVSSVVNGTSTVSAALRARVEEAIRVSGYQPSVLARSLRTGQTKTVGLSIGDITNPFYTDIVSVLQKVLHSAGYGVMLCCNQRSVTLQDEQIALMRGRAVDGMIVSPVGNDARIKSALAGYGGPVVLIDRELPGYDNDIVLLDNRAAVAMAMDHLIGLGHRRIGFISGMPQSYTGGERLRGYREALAKADIAEDDGLIQYGNFRMAEAIDAAQRLLAMEQRPTAILSANNLSTIGTMHALSAAGIRCPADISLVSIDDFPWADLFELKLTAIAQPLEAIGQQAARLLLDRLSGHYAGERRKVVLQGEMHLRNSTRAIADIA